VSTFIYIQKVDTGLAPCVYRGIWSLALCKPTIRRSARDGDIIIAVTPKEDGQDGHRLSSWAKVSGRVSMEEFSRIHSPNRPDNIYEKLPRGKYVRRRNVKHELHNTKEDLQHDLGKDGKNAWALVSTDFFAFGNHAVDFFEWTQGLSHLRSEVKKLGRAFRRKFNKDVENDLQKLKRTLKKNFPKFHNKKFKPQHPGLNVPCESNAEEKRFTCVKTKR